MTNKHLLHLYEIHQSNDEVKEKVIKIKKYFDENLICFNDLVNDLNERNYAKHFHYINITLQRYINLFK